MVKFEKFVGMLNLLYTLYYMATSINPVAIILIHARNGVTADQTLALIHMVIASFVAQGSEAALIRIIRIGLL